MDIHFDRHDKGEEETKAMEYLPIGTVVKTTRMDKTLMIYGRRQHSSLKDENYDYVAVLFPEGNISSKFNYFFNADEITEIVFKGFVNEDEIDFQDKVLNKKRDAID